MEWYASTYDSSEAAVAAIHGHRRASYDAVGPFEIAMPIDEGRLLEVLEEVCGDIDGLVTEGVSMCDHYLAWTDEDNDSPEGDSNA